MPPKSNRSEFARVRAEVPKMFAQTNQDVLDSNVAQNPLKVRPCFIRLFRDKELDKHIKRCKKSEAEVNRPIILSLFLFQMSFCCMKHFAGVRLRVQVLQEMTMV